MPMAHSGGSSRLLSALILFFCLTLSTTAFAATKPDRTSWGQNISIGPNQALGDLTCFGCNIQVRGQVAGDVTAFFGSIIIEDQAQISGDVTAFGGNIRLDQEVKVNGGVTVFGGEIRRSSQASVKGDVTALGGRAWFVPLLLAPFVILGLLIAFVVWLVRRIQRPSPSTAAA